MCNDLIDENVLAIASLEHQVTELTSEKEGLLGQLKAEMSLFGQLKRQRDDELQLHESDMKKLKESAASLAEELKVTKVKVMVAESVIADEKKWSAWMEHHPAKSGEIVFLNSDFKLHRDALYALKPMGADYAPAKYGVQKWVVKPGYHLRPFAQWLPLGLAAPAHM